MLTYIWARTHTQNCFNLLFLLQWLCYGILQFKFRKVVMNSYKKVLFQNSCLTDAWLQFLETVFWGEDDKKEEVMFLLESRTQKAWFPLKVSAES